MTAKQSRRYRPPPQLGVRPEWSPCTIIGMPGPSGEQQSSLAEPNVAILASVDRRNRAHAAPVWYLYDDGEIVISTGRGSQKHRNIEANGEISVVIDRR